MAGGNTNTNFIQSSFGKVKAVIKKDNKAVYLDRIKAKDKANKYSPLNRFLICVLKGLLIWALSYTTVTAFAYCFELPYNHGIVFIASFLFSQFIALLYFNKIIFYTGYILMFITFLIELVRNYIVVNSGFQAIINIVYEKYSDYFALSSLREGQELIENRYYTITITLVFVAIFISILLNVTISGYMNMLESMLVTWPLIEIALFVDIMPKPIYFVILIACYVAVGLLQLTGHMRMQVKGRRTPEFIKVRFGKKPSFSYQANVLGIVYIMLLSVLIGTVLSVVAFAFYSFDGSSIHSKKFHDFLDEPVKIYVQNGFTGLFNRYEATGGMSSGRLGGVASIRNDYNNDFTITFMPFNNDSLYLPGFIGNEYLTDKWSEQSPKYETVDGEERIVDFITTTGELVEYESEHRINQGATAKAVLQNIDISPTQLLRPYYTYDSEVLTFPDTSVDTVQPFPLGGSTEVNYNPLVYNIKLIDNYGQINNFASKDYIVSYLRQSSNEESLMYAEYVDDMALRIRENEKSYIEDFTYNYMSDYIFPSNPADVDSSIDGLTDDGEISYEELNEINEYRLDVCNMIYSEFVRDFEYTKAPGNTPFNEDYIDHFLNGNRRGFCAHFATSAAMILREKGIPARYVEGYVIPTSLMAENGALTSEDPDEWYQGTSLLDDRGVITLNVTDAYAHAWVEVYMEGYGFVPFEFTPPSYENDINTESGGNLADLLGSLFTVNFNVNTGSELTGTLGEDPGNNEGRLSEALSILNINKIKVRKTVTWIIVIIGLIIAYMILSPVIYRRILISKGKYKPVVYNLYNNLLQRSSLSKILPKAPSEDDVKEALNTIRRDNYKKASNMSSEQIDRFILLTKQALYSGASLTKEEFNEYVKLLKVIKKAL
ncbi:MAG: transglutaminase-like domain-containing protein [Lachnospiraceae bacterium]|nr:transglutaminase-like domain-containing protein [Lachnospiraceae bacterium]